MEISFIFPFNTEVIKMISKAFSHKMFFLKPWIKADFETKCY